MLLLWQPKIYTRKSNSFAKIFHSGDYVNLLEENSILDDAVETLGAGFKFQQDGATPHTAKTTLEYLKTKCNLIVNWPQNSPDLNVIEMIWGILKLILAELRPRTVAEFKMRIFEACNQLSIDTTIKKRVNSFTKRCYLCLENEGKNINHLIHCSMEAPTEEQIEELFTKCIEKGMVLNEISLFNPKV